MNQSQMSLVLQLLFATGIFACSFQRTQTMIDIRADGRVMTEADEVRIEARDTANAVVFLHTLRAASW